MWLDPFKNVQGASEYTVSLDLNMNSYAFENISPESKILLIVGFNSYWIIKKLFLKVHLWRDRTFVL